METRLKRLEIELEHIKRMVETNCSYITALLAGPGNNEEAELCCELNDAACLYCEKLNDMISFYKHQEGKETSVSLKDLLGMEVVGIGKGKCDGCPMDHYQADCVKVELVGGDYICLAKPKPEEADSDNVMGDIKEKVEEFIDYLDSVVGN